MEMGAPDADDVDDVDDFPIVSAVAESEPAHITTPPVVEPLAAGRERARAGAAAVAPRAAVLRPSLSAGAIRRTGARGRALARFDPDRERHPAKPNIPANDPLAPIRRMSQAEKIAFFS